MEALAGVSAADAEALKKAFNVKTIGEAPAGNKHVLAAQTIANLARPQGLIAEGLTPRSRG